MGMIYILIALLAPLTALADQTVFLAEHPDYVGTVFTYFGGPEVDELICDRIDLQSQPPYFNTDNYACWEFDLNHDGLLTTTTRCVGFLNWHQYDWPFSYRCLRAGIWLKLVIGIEPMAC